ncbi:acyltransferase family protein [Gordonia rubripertincta]|uniref:acyltransferase family protein n=1 Tax=Gordonia rubripertincta TaxID=36822 RepID=UPI0027DCE458|nr:acyltransferase [Gordonia rubripertincta]
MELLRILGVIAIVAGHVWDNQFTREAIYTWHVPVFFVLTGYFWKRKDPQGVSTSAYIRTRARRLLVPYGMWLVLIAVPFVAVLTVRDSHFPIDTIGRMLWGGAAIGRPFSAFWFVTALFFAVLLLRAMRRFPGRVSWVVAIAAVTVAYVTDGALAKVPLSFGVAVPALIFILAGAAFRSLRSSVKPAPLVAVVLIGASAAAVITGLSRPLDLKQADFGTPVLSVLVAVAISFGLIVLAETVVAWTGRAADWTLQLAAGGFMVVLSHAAILWLLDTPPTGRWIDFAVALLLPWGAALVLRYTAVSPYLLGVDRICRQRPTTPPASDRNRFEDSI